MQINSRALNVFSIIATRVLISNGSDEWEERMSGKGMSGWMFHEWVDEAEWVDECSMEWVDEINYCMQINSRALNAFSIIATRVLISNCSDEWVERMSGNGMSGRMFHEWVDEVEWVARFTRDTISAGLPT